MVSVHEAVDHTRRWTRTSVRIRAPRDAVYRAFLDPHALAAWRVPDQMSGRVLSFDSRAGGAYRMSLVYRDSDHPAVGKTTEDGDTFGATFVELVPHERIVEAIDFETGDPNFTGWMTVTTSLTVAGDDTEVTMEFEDIPPGVSLEDNLEGTRQSLRKLASYLGQT